ncbi:MAG TPA: alpha/beta hydrolase [Aliidongia sp.]|uniref:alpha/beta fold hydrolase n=1 Tax=Aliidongia sp. TaxID=1914230 RepID=UPI002DDD834D|nr:alpha/beta hydrolase [Aliidongia sp.]HEV2676989.1 alpha/beta hydrolase [Aliidongia sp.]
MAGSFKRLALAVALLGILFVGQASAAHLRYGWQDVDGVSLFYREGGPVDAPTLVLLHGNPASSIMYEAIMTDLVETRGLHVIAMDYPSFDYGTNIVRYPAWQQRLKSLAVPVLVIWGSRDDFFTTPGAFAYLRDAPQAEIHILDTVHFATLEAPDPIAALVGDFARRHDLR